MAWMGPYSMPTIIYDPNVSETVPRGETDVQFTSDVLRNYVSNDMGAYASKLRYSFPKETGWTLFVPPFATYDRSFDDDVFFKASTVSRKILFDELFSSKQMSLQTNVPYVNLEIYVDDDESVYVNGAAIVKCVNVGSDGIIYVTSKPVLS